MLPTLKCWRSLGSQSNVLVEVVPSRSWGIWLYADRIYTVHILLNYVHGHRAVTSGLWESKDMTTVDTIATLGNKLPSIGELIYRSPESSNKPAILAFTIIMASNRDIRTYI